jgi:hypothetical protein
MPNGISIFIPLWGLITIAGVGAWIFGYRIIAVVGILAGLFVGGWINL